MGESQIERIGVETEDFHPAVSGTEASVEQLVVQVVDARTGTGIPASITVAGRSLVTRRDGHLEIELRANSAIQSQDPTEVVALQVSSPGYEALIVQKPLIGGVTQEVQRIALQVASHLSVRVLNVHLKSADEATVYVASFSHSDNRWRKGTVGVTDKKGECEGRAQVGDWIIAQAKDGSVSDWIPYVRADTSITLHCDGWVESPQLYFAGSGAKVSKRRLLVSRDTGLPSLRWESLTNANGLLSGFLAPGKFRIEAVDRDMQLDSSGQGDFAWSVILDLKKLPSQSQVRTMVSDLSAWAASVQESGSGAPINNGVARIFRSAIDQEGIQQRIEVGKQSIVGGILSLALLRAEELSSFELELDCPGYERLAVTGTDPRLSLRRQPIVFELRKSPPEAIRFLDLQGSPIDRRVWLYDDFGNLVASGRPGTNGILKGVLGSRGRLFVCLYPAKESAIAVIPARIPSTHDAYTCILDLSAQLVIRYGEGDVPNPFLVLHSLKGAELQGFIQGRDLVFAPLGSDRYSIGAREQLRESGTIQDPIIKYPIQLVKGERLVLEAKSSWSLIEGGDFVQGNVDHRAPIDLVVIPIFSDTDPKVAIRAPEFVAPVLDDGDFSLWAASKISYVAVGSLDSNGRLVPLAILPATRASAVLNPRRLYVRAASETEIPLTVMVLPSIPGGKVQGRIVQLLPPGESTMVGWLQPGRHFLQIPGSRQQGFTMSDGGDCEVVLDGEGQIVEVGMP